MPASDQITEKIIAAVAEVKRLPVESVSPDKSLLDLGFDSLDTINLLFALEEAFNISIPDEEAGKVTKVSDIVSGVRKLLSQSAGSPGEHAA